MGNDQDLRTALIRTSLVLLQREVREKSNWYTTPRVVVRKRSGKVQLTRLGARPSRSSRKPYISLSDVEDSPAGFTIISAPSTPLSAVSWVELQPMSR
ncbi:hypothetical protein F5Y15DRAFT_412022 [Xylariaceae sp. FL0016]|nr:hypothetical protein F5Y15DRAFT_412022 [Xylariaceae sp. FL0016]